MAKLYVTPMHRAFWHDMLVDGLRMWRAEEARAEREGGEPVGVPLPSIAPAVAIQIGAHFDNSTGETFVGQDTIAAELSISERIVWQSIRGYSDRGLLIVRRRGPRSNYYGMPIERVAAVCESYREKSRNRVRDKNSDDPHSAADQAGLVSQISPQRVAAGCGVSPSPSEKFISARGCVRDRAPRAGSKQAFEGPAPASVWIVPGTPEFDACLNRMIEMGSQATGEMRRCQVEGKPFLAARSLIESAIARRA